MKKKIVGMRELETFSNAANKAAEALGKLSKTFDAAALIMFANQAAGNLDAALAIAMTAAPEALKVFDALVDEFEPAARAYLGEGRGECESRAEYFGRISSMSSLEMFQVQTRNGIAFLPGA